MFSRKSRGNKPDVNPETANSDHSSNRESTRPRSLFSLSKTLTRVSTTSTSINRSEDVKGPLGLNLLWSPESPQIDFIFIHGLGGSSRKTWSKSPLESHFWPKEWLSIDPAFKNVRIHSYGYDSYYLKGKEDCLNVHHLGKSFLSAISTSPSIGVAETLIVIIGHSMGGLVMKKAYILAKQDAIHDSLSKRFSSFYFLATPHRGSDSAKLLKNLLKVAYDRNYVGDLEPNSGAVQVINDGFRHVSAGLELCSFYETQNMKMFSSLIVDPESAVLGYREEKQTPMTADHRSICKFETPEDPNYALLRNSLASTVSNLCTIIPEARQKQRREDVKSLKQYLDVFDVVDEDLMNVCEARIQHSCEWIESKKTYQEWTDETSARRILWLKGKPATGKSVLAGYVIDRLKESGHPCSYFFFKHGDRSKSSLNRCLRSLAFQMASCNVKARSAILGMQADDLALDRVDDRTFWRTVFLSGLLQAAATPQYWVIDALDEFSNSLSFFSVILSRLDESIPLKILITSRDTADLDQGFAAIPANLVQLISMSRKDTESDIKLLLETRLRDLSMVAPDDQENLVETILDKSKGSFLWTILVLDELLRCHSRNEVQQILEAVPRGMEPLYRRILDSMSRATRGKELAKSILMWAACGIRPLTIGELGGALSSENQDSFPRLGESIAALCGQLVKVDKRGRVKMVHETAREFLLSNRIESEFSIVTVEAHTRMAEICLLYLNGDEMKPPKYNRRRSSATLPSGRLEFSLYAYSAYSYHLSRADPSAMKPFLLVFQFLKGNVLSWIEAIAKSRDLNPIIRASKHLKTYVNACAVERSPLDPQLQALRQWSMDLARIPAMFATALISAPSAIYSWIPAFCPTSSMIHNTGASSHKIAIFGSVKEQWDDRLFSVDFRKGQARVVRYGDEFLAVGLSSGSVVLYHATSHQEYKVMAHGEGVELIAFKPKSDLLATCGMKLAKVWDIRSGQMIHSFAGAPRPMGMDFNGDVLLVASARNFFLCWDLGTDTTQQKIQKPWYDRDISDRDMGKPYSPGTPSALTFSINQGILVVAYSSKPIIIWDIEENLYVGSCGKKHSNGETSTHPVVALALNPNPDISLLAVAYLDGDLVLLDPFTNNQLECFRANCQSLSSSPNGRLLAAGGANGIIQVYEFDTFKLLYQVKSSNSYIQELAFSKDNMRLSDIRDSQCTVWEPEALLRETINDDSSGTTLTSTVETVAVEAKRKITALAIHHESELIFCGKDDGSVVLYEQKFATILGILYCHKSSVRKLAWVEERNALLSIDAGNNIFLHQVNSKSPETGSSWAGNLTVLFQCRLDSQMAIMDLLIRHADSRFLVSTGDSDHLWDLDTGRRVMEKTHSQISYTRKWLPHPTSALHLICIDGIKLNICSWYDLCEVSSTTLPLGSQMKEVKSGYLNPEGKYPGVLVHLADPGSSLKGDHLLMVQEAPKITSDDEVPSISVTCTQLKVDISHIIGVDQSDRLIFLNRNFWVCSLYLSHSKFSTSNPEDTPSFAPEVFQHFFIPYDWFAGARDILSAPMRNDIIITRGGHLAVIRGGLDHPEKVSIR